jgi:nucleotide-binding universal stress UspA family protein
MRILISYDGSRHSEAAIDDLAVAGLPAEGDVIVITVAEVWLPPPNVEGNDSETDPYIESIVRKHREHGEALVAEAHALAERAAERVKQLLPRWKVMAESTYGSPAWEIIKKAEVFRTDLIVVGSHGHSAIGRLVLGSISQRVVTEAVCSVRIGRGRVEVDPAPARVIIGFDGSRGSSAAVDAVAARKWPDGSEIRLVAALDGVSPSIIGRLIPPVVEMTDEMNRSEMEWIENLSVAPLEKLKGAGYPASLQLHAGNPKRVLIEEAERWNADCIFVGANAFGSRIERFLIGSTSSAVAARAHCSVEIIRK